MPDDEGRCTLILDLDETLVRAEVTLGVREDTACTFVSGGRVHGVRVNIRPGAAAFLAILAEWFELVIFTASCRVCVNTWELRVLYRTCAAPQPEGPV